LPEWATEASLGVEGRASRRTIRHQCRPPPERRERCSQRPRMAT
jgi:hypothetical protein